MRRATLRRGSATLSRDAGDVRKTLITPALTQWNKLPAEPWRWPRGSVIAPDAVSRFDLLAALPTMGPANLMRQMAELAESRSPPASVLRACSARAYAQNEELYP